MMRRKTERGTALISALVVIILVGLMAGLGLSRTQMIARDTHRDRGELQAFYAAEAGLARAAVELRSAAWTGGTFRVGLCDVVVEVAPADGGGWRVRSTATAFVAGRKGPKVVTQLTRLVRP